MLPIKILRREFSSSVSLHSIKNVTVIGSGLMGAGIAQVSAQAGQTVVMMDSDEVALKKANDRIGESIKRVAKKKFGDDKDKATNFINNSLSKITISTNVAESVKSADIVIEAIIENLKIKQDLFIQLEKEAPKTAILASNTSSLPIAKICEHVQKKERCGGLHFFNPVPVMKLLEVVTIAQTSNECYEAMANWGKAIGKVTVKCRDTPGFIVNRLLIPYALEANRMYERGDASKRDIDTAMKLGAGYPMGPFELGDYTGLDTSYNIIKGWEELYPDEPLFAMPQSLKKLFSEGKYGMKTGEGHYSYK